MVLSEIVVKGLVVSNVAPPPLLGFNNNVRHRGRIFHIQTEDSGIKNPRIVTHLFADGGRIIKTTRTDYAEHVNRADMQPFVRSLMKEQHKAMFTALRLGELDALLESMCGPFSQPPQMSKAPASSAAPTSEVLPAASAVALASAASLASAPPFASAPPYASASAPPFASAPPYASASAAPAQEDPESDAPPPSRRQHELSNPNLHRVTPSVVPPDAGGFDLDVGALDRLPGKPPPPPIRGDRSPQAPAAAMRADRTPEPPPAPIRAKLKSRPGQVPPPPPSMSRPSSRFAAVPPKSSQSIFGDGAISEQSLDEVILSYLAEDLEGGSE